MIDRTQNLGNLEAEKRGKPLKKLVLFVLYIAIAIIAVPIFFIPNSFMQGVFNTNNQLLIVIMGLVIVGFLIIAAVNAIKKMRTSMIEIYEYGFLIHSDIEETTIFYDDVAFIECFDISPFKRYIYIYSTYALEFYDINNQSLGQIKSESFTFKNEGFEFAPGANPAEIKKKILDILKVETDIK